MIFYEEVAINKELVWFPLSPFCQYIVPEKANTNNELQKRERKFCINIVK